MHESDIDAKIGIVDVAVALSLLSRLPVNAVFDIPHTAWTRQCRSVWAFPLAGLCIGIVAAACGWAALAIGLPVNVAAGIILASLILSTGAMHEDGLADCADGFWGGWTREKRLKIMKDSHIGVYGILAVILATGLRWSSYGVLLANSVAPVVATAVLSRCFIPMAMAKLPHARETGLARSVGSPSAKNAWVSVALGLGLSFLLVGWSAFGAAIGACAAVALVCALAKSKVGGQTGDVLGAAQQIAELAVLLVLLI